MVHHFDLTSEHGVRQYLEANGQSQDFGVTLLSGGTANYVYRISNKHGSTSIIKHAAPYLHSNKNFAFDPARMDYEAKALGIFSPARGISPLSELPPDPSVHAVQMINYEKELKLLHIEDGGSRNLKDAYDDLKLDIPKIGQGLAQWVAAVHMCSKDISLALSPDDPEPTGSNNNSIAVNIYRHSYNNLHTALTQYGHDPKLAERINEDFGSLLTSDDECICHGDYWPGNVLVRLPNSERDSTKLTIVDWEMVRRGTGATDVGQFAAEAFLLDRFRGGRSLLPAFLNAYAAARNRDSNNTTNIDRKWVKRMVVHWAVHVAFWPSRVVWTDTDGTQQLVDIGVTLLKKVLEEDWEKVLESPLLRDVKEAWTPVLMKM